MTNAEIIAAVAWWQRQPWVHPLACERDYRHRPLRAVEQDSHVVLACPDCDYQRTHIPAIIMRNQFMRPAIQSK